MSGHRPGEPEDPDRTIIRPRKSDNPFAEPGDVERTVIIRPTPGGRRSTSAQPPPSAAPAAPPAPPRAVTAPTPSPPAAPRQAFSPPPRQAGAPSPRPAQPDAPPPDIPFSTPSGSPLTAAAMPLLQVLVRLRATAHQPDPADLYRRTVNALRHFEQRVREAGVPPEQIRPAHYALCASLDDVVLNTPWGAASDWARRPLAAAFHQDTSHGGGFCELLMRLRQDAARSMPVIEIMYLCLSLGFMGPYRTTPRGSAELDRLRAETGALITAQKSLAPELSVRWQGIAAPHVRTRGGVPVWVGYAVALAACGLLFLWVSTSLNAASDRQAARMLSAPPAQMPSITRAALVQPLPPPPAPPEPTVIDRLQAGLKTDIDASLVTITGTPATPVIRVATRTGLPTGAATLQPALAALFERIGTLLRNEPGPVDVVAYTDNQPIRTVQFPSNFQLSIARAKAAGAAIAHTIGNSARIGTEGRADADPIASNATAEGREQNRRIEIVLHRQG